MASFWVFDGLVLEPWQPRLGMLDALQIPSNPSLASRNSPDLAQYPRY